MLFEQFYSNYNNSLQLHFQPPHCNENSPSTSSFPDNPPALEIWQDTHILTNLLTLLTNLFLFFPSWIFILHQRSLSLFSGLSFLSISPQRSYLQNKFKLPSLHWLLRSVSLLRICLPMFKEQPQSDIFVNAKLSAHTNGTKAELRALYNCFNHHGPAMCLSNSTPVQHLCLWTLPKSTESLSYFPSHLFSWHQTKTSSLYLGLHYYDVLFALDRWTVTEQ